MPAINIKKILSSTSFPYLSSNVFLVEIGEILLLYDSGNHFLKEKLVSALKERNIDTAQIRFVVNSHLHYDHCGNNDLFKNAKIIVSYKEYQFAQQLLKMTKENLFLLFKKLYKGYSDSKIRSYTRLFWANRFVIEWLRGHEDQLEFIKQNKILLDKLSVLNMDESHCAGHLCLHASANSIRFCLAGDLFKGTSSDSYLWDTSYLISDVALLIQQRYFLNTNTDIIYPGHGDNILVK